MEQKFIELYNDYDNGLMVGKGKLYTESLDDLSRKTLQAERASEENPDRISAGRRRNGQSDNFPQATRRCLFPAEPALEMGAYTGSLLAIGGLRQPQQTQCLLI